jgi:hypothetical protein
MWHNSGPLVDLRTEKTKEELKKIYQIRDEIKALNNY